VHEVNAQEVGGVVRDTKIKIKVAPRLGTGASEVNVRDEELVGRCAEGSEILLISSGRHIIMNSDLEGLR